MEPGIIKERSYRLRNLGQQKRETFYRRCFGKSFLVLTEGWLSEEKKMIKGFSENYLPVTFPSSQLLKNNLVSVRVEKLGGNGVVGTVDQSPVSSMGEENA